ncbi:hypothetical protein LXL04_020779 [Taraxacum kok-saghyz]
MVLQTERCASGYKENNYSAHQGPDGYYSNFQGITATQSPPYSSYPQMSTYPSNHASQYQSSWSTGDEYHGNGPNHPVKPGTVGYGNSYGYGNSHGYENSLSHGNQQAHGHPQVHGSPHGHGHGHGSPNSLGTPYGYGKSHDYEKSHGYEKPHGFGNGLMKPLEKLAHGHGYGAPGPNYGHGHPASGMNHGYQKPSWTLKGLEDDE